MSQQAIEDIRFLGKRLRGILDLADTLEGVLSLEQIIQERKTAIQKLQEEESFLSQQAADYRQTQKDHENSLTKREEEFNQYKIKAYEEISNKGKSVLSAANDKAKDILNKAELSYNTILSSTSEKEKTLQELQKNIEASENKLANLTDSIDRLRKQLNG